MNQGARGSTAIRTPGWYVLRSKSIRRFPSGRADFFLPVPSVNSLAMGFDYFRKDE
jgi:hypothetical protein